MWVDSRSYSHKLKQSFIQVLDMMGTKQLSADGRIGWLKLASGKTGRATEGEMGEKGVIFNRRLLLGVGWLEGAVLKWHTN